MRVQDRYKIEVGAIFSHIKDNDLPTTKTLRDKKLLGKLIKHHLMLLVNDFIMNILKVLMENYIFRSSYGY